MDTNYISVTVGNLGNGEVTVQRLKENGIIVTDSAEYLLNKIPYEQTLATLKVVKLKPENVLEKRSWVPAKIYAGIRHNDLWKLPPEVGPQLWLQYPKILEEGEGAFVLMDPYRDKDEHYMASLKIFGLSHDKKGRWLDDDSYDSDSICKIGETNFDETCWFFAQDKT